MRQPRGVVRCDGGRTGRALPDCQAHWTVRQTTGQCGERQDVCASLSIPLRASRIPCRYAHRGRAQEKHGLSSWPLGDSASMFRPSTADYLRRFLPRRQRPRNTDGCKTGEAHNQSFQISPRNFRKPGWRTSRRPISSCDSRPFCRSGGFQHDAQRLPTACHTLGKFL